MADDLLAKLESRIMSLVDQLERARRHIDQLSQENRQIKADSQAAEQRLQNLLDLLDEGSSQQSDAFAQTSF